MYNFLALYVLFVGSQNKSESLQGGDQGEDAFRLTRCLKGCERKRSLLPAPTQGFLERPQEYPEDQDRPSLPA